MGYDGAVSYGIVRQYAKTRNWGEWQAFREIVQNALDELQDVYGEWPSRLPCYSTINETIVKDTGRGIGVRHLYIGSSEKPAWSRGKFGEGLKLALLVFTNLGVPVVIRSGNKEIGNKEFRPIFVPIDIEGSRQELFCVCYRNIPQQIQGTEVHIGDPTLCSRFRHNFVQGLVEDGCPYFRLESRSGGRIDWWRGVLDCDEARDKVFVRDIFVMEHPSLFGYNLFNVNITESRDIIDYYSAVKDVEETWYQILHGVATKQFPADKESWARDLLKRWIKWTIDASITGSQILESDIYIPFMYDEDIKLINELYDELYGDKFLVVSDPQSLELAKYVGYNPLFCTSTFCGWISGVIDAHARIIRKIRSETGSIPKDKLPPPLKCIVNYLEEILYILVGGFGDIKIEYAYLKEGVCGEARSIPGTHVGTVLLNIDCLLKYCRIDQGTPEYTTTDCVREYVSVAAHEIAHIRSGASDGSTDFERELTRLIGFVATNAISGVREIKKNLEMIYLYISNTKQCT